MAEFDWVQMYIIGHLTTRSIFVFLCSLNQIPQIWYKVELRILLNISPGFYGNDQ